MLVDGKDIDELSVPEKRLKPKSSSCQEDRNWISAGMAPYKSGERSDDKYALGLLDYDE